MSAEFGTGAVKITPAHDFNDFEVAGRHGLESINILDINAVLNENAHKYEGLDRYAGKKEDSRGARSARISWRRSRRIRR